MCRILVCILIATFVANALTDSETVPEETVDTILEETAQETVSTKKQFPRKNLTWPQSDGFMSMAHMVNSMGKKKTSSYNWAKGDGANAIEVDVAFCGVTPCQMRHSAPEVDGKMAGGVTFKTGKVNPTPGMACDCSCYNGATIWAADKDRNVCGWLYKDATVGTGGVGCQAYTPFKAYLNKFAADNHFRMLYLDNKVAAGWNKAQQIAAGAIEARIVIDELFEKGYTGKVMFDGATRDWQHFIQAAIHEFGEYKGGKFFRKVYFTYGFMDYDGAVLGQRSMVRASIRAMREDFCTGVDHGTTKDATQVVEKCESWHIGDKCVLNGQYCKEKGGWTCINHKWKKGKRKNFSTATANGNKWKTWDHVALLRNRLPHRADIKKMHSRKLLGSGNHKLGGPGVRCKSGKRANFFYSIGISACSAATHTHMIKQAIADKKAGLGLSYVLVWTIDKSSSMKSYIDMGVDGIMTNYPSRTYMAAANAINKKKLKGMMRL